MIFLPQNLYRKLLKRQAPMTKGSKLLVGFVSVRIKGVTEWKKILENIRVFEKYRRTRIKVK